MKVLGVEISGRDVRIVALHVEEEDISDVTGNYKPIKLEDDETATNVILFRNTLYAAFDDYSPDVIVVKYRSPNGKGIHASSPISFKIEGIIQIYEKSTVLLTRPQTISAFFKKNSLSLNPTYSYQTEAMKLAFHYIKSRK